VLKQIELTAAVKDRLNGQRQSDKDLPFALAIVESVKSWLKEIKKFRGRFPNDIHSLYQGEHPAVSLLK
jgi:hypothetical protein